MINARTNAATAPPAILAVSSITRDLAAVEEKEKEKVSFLELSRLKFSYINMSHRDLCNRI